MEQSKSIRIMSFREWRENEIIKKKKGNENVSRGSKTGGQVGATNVQGQDDRNPQEVPIQRVSVFPMPQ